MSTHTPVDRLDCAVDKDNTATMELCGCISGTRDGIQSVQYCKVHAQAPAMQEALKAVVHCNDYCYIDGPSEGALPSVTYEFSQVLKHIETLLAHIAKGD